MKVEFFMPKVTDNMDTGMIVGWLVKEGDRVEKGQPILEVETDKATVELEAPASGNLTGILEGMVKGATVPVGQTIAFIVDGESLPTPPPSIGPSRQPHGDGQRTTQADPSSEPGEERTPRGDLSSPGDEWLELTPVQIVTGQRMTESVHNVPHFSLTVCVDMGALLELKSAMRQQPQAHSSDLPSLTGFLVKLLAGALRESPRFNASFEGSKVKLHGNVNIGVAVGTDAGLVVPVIRDADKKSLAQIARDLALFRDKAAAMRFSLEDIANGTFTVSNLGMFGVDEFEAIINPPQVAILAIGRVVNTPVGTASGEIVLRPISRLTLSLDHRAVDGVAGARFLSALKDRIERPRLED